MREKVESHRDLQVYRKAFDAAGQLFQLSNSFPKEEKYSLTDQLRRSSRSVCANLAEVWRKRLYEASFVCKICDAEGEAAETQVWIEFGVRCGYLERDEAAALYQTYDEILRMLVAMRTHASSWTLPR
jgi:four helix bundle protein